MPDPDPLVDVVLPCLDEAAALPWVLGRFPADYRPLVVDNGSTDATADVARAHGAQVVVEPRRGYGAACHAGLLAATAAMVAVMDADGSLDPAQLPRLLERLREGTGPRLVLGRRCPTTPDAHPWPLRLANREVCRRTRRVTGVHLHDLGPVRVARREDLLALHLRDRRSGYPLETVVRAAAARWDVVEVDVDYAPRTGRSKVTGTPLGALRAVADMRLVLRAAQQPTGAHR